MAFLLREVLGEHPRIEIIGQAWTVEEAVRISSTLVPDVVVISSGVAMGQDAVSLAERVYRANPCAIVIVTAECLPDSLRQELLGVCAIPLAAAILDLTSELEELLPDLKPPE